MPISDSYLSWTVLTERDQHRAAEFLRSYRQTDTIDELGFGAIRDYYADIFFPATTTIMTRARYFSFLLSIFLHLERRRVKSKDFGREVMRMENRLREILSVTESADSSGVIGKVAKERLFRYPSNIYWNAMKGLKIFRNTGWYLSAYYRDIDRYHDRMSGAIVDDDGNPQAMSSSIGHWEIDDDVNEFVPKMFAKSDDWIDKIDFTLSTNEAQYLKRRFEAAFPNSLLFWQLKKKILRDSNYPWDIEGPNELRTMLEDARLFSVLTKSATLVYYALLVRAKREDSDPYVASLDSWLSTQAAVDFRKWSIGDWKERGVIGGLPFRRGDKEFFLEWWNIVCASDSGKELLLKGGDVIRRREEHMKPRRSRLAGGAYLDRWESPDLSNRYFSDPDLLPYHLTYRNFIGNRIATDIIGSLT